MAKGWYWTHATDYEDAYAATPLGGLGCCRARDRDRHRSARGRRTPDARFEASAHAHHHDQTRRVHGSGGHRSERARADVDSVCAPRWFAHRAASATEHAEHVARWRADRGQHFGIERTAGPIRVRLRDGHRSGCALGFSRRPFTLRDVGGGSDLRRCLAAEQHGGRCRFRAVRHPRSLGARRGQHVALGERFQLGMGAFSLRPLDVDWTPRVGLDPGPRLRTRVGRMAHGVLR
jgi:hypothetical protein